MTKMGNGTTFAAVFQTNFLVRFQSIPFPLRSIQMHKISYETDYFSLANIIEKVENKGPLILSVLI